MVSNNNICFMGTVDIDNQFKAFGLLQEDRRRHVYILGKSGMGKSTLLENMILQDIYSGQGVCFLDPLGDSAESIMDQIPRYRQKDVVYFNPVDTEFPIGLNMLESKGEPDFLIASSLMTVLKRIWEGAWSSRMEYILNNTILALLEVPNSTLLGVVKLLTDKGFRDYVTKNCKNILVKNFWDQEFPRLSQQYQSEAVAPILNKVGQFFSTSMIRNILGQSTSSINFRDIMDNRKILIANLAKGKIGEDNSSLLGSMIVSKFQLAAMSRSDMPEKDRNDFFLYVDEFQNFITDSFATILSEARKYRLCLTIAHQYIAQLSSEESEKIKNAIFGNVGSIVTFRVGSNDSEILEKELQPVLKENFLNLDSRQIIAKLSVSNRTLDPFVASTLPPIYASIKGNKQELIDYSRYMWGVNVEKVEEEITTFFTKGLVVDTVTGEAVSTKKKRKRKKKKPGESGQLDSEHESNSEGYSDSETNATSQGLTD
ncbi:MAG: type IV secretion system DNA-binding domain-containing protein [Patescibacteria group bacterium]